MSSDRLEALMKQAEELIQARRYEEAFLRFEEALQINPRDIDCLKAFSKLLLGLRQYERAASTFEKILQVNPACTSILHSYKSVLFKLGKGSQANKIFDQALGFVLKQDLASSNVLLAYTNLFMAIGNYLKVAKIFEYAFENHPKDLKLLLAYVKFLIKEGRIKEAIQEIDPLFVSGYEKEDEQELYQSLSHLEKYERSYRIFEDLLKKHPSNAVLLRCYIKSLINSKQYTKAFNVLISVFQVNSESLKLLDIYIQKMRESNQDNLMLSLCEKIDLENTPNSKTTLYHFCKSLFRKPAYIQIFIKIMNSFFELPVEEKTEFEILNYLQGDPKPLLMRIEVLMNNLYVDEALRISKFMSECEPHSTAILTSYAKNLMQSGNHKEASATFEQLLQLEPSNSKILTSNSKILIRYASASVSAGQHEKALQLFEQALEIEPDSPITLSRYAGALAATGQNEKAIEVFEHSLQLEPNNPVTLSRYACALASTGQTEKAIQSFERSLQLEPNDPITLSRYAVALVSTGQTKKAIQSFGHSLQLEPNDPITLSNYARALVSTGQTEKAIQSFELLLLLEPNNPITLSRYAVALVSTGQTKKAIQSFERSLQLEPNDPITLSRYAVALTSIGQTEKAIQSFERLLQLEPNNPITLSRYAAALVSTGQTEKAIQSFERSLQLEPDNPITLSCYAVALTSIGQTEKAIQSFERLLQIEPNDPITLNQYASALASTGQIEKVIQSLERLLQLEPDNPITLSRYAGALASTGQTEKAFQIFERSLRINPNDVITLSRYINALLKAERYKRAIELSEHLLGIEPNNIATLTKYGSALVGAGLDLQGLEVYRNLLMLEPNNAYILGHYGILLANLDNYEKACSVFSDCLQVRPDSYISFQYARALEKVDKHQEAIDQLESINIDLLTPYQANVIRVNLGRLYYRMKQLEKGSAYFDAAIANSDDKERTLLYSARSIFASNPYSETAVEMLQQIAEDSPRYAQALEMLTLNVNEEDYFEMVKTDSQSGLSDTEMLNRAMYHKIANEISILKGIAYRILRRFEREDPLLSGIIQDIEDVFSEVDRRRSAQKSEIETISHNDYDSILAVISKTAHDISDFVNNQLAVIESKTRRAMQKLQADDAHYAQFEKLLMQLELTQAALNDLKAINEGIRIKYRRFKVRKLFEKWEAVPQIGQAQIVLDIQNGNSEFNGDEEKIKSALNELVENSLKHNLNQPDLTIHITSQDVMNPPGIWGRTIPGEQKYLFIEFADNGKGVTGDKKDWIFQPLKTTSQEDKGSGLGLFIIRKTLTQMNGYIRETGRNGARFEIYIPYSKAEA